MLSALERAVVAIVLSEDPVAARPRVVRRFADDLSDDERALLLAADADGLRLTGLLVRKLRFERLLRADPEAARSFESDPAAFTREFERYVAAENPTAYFPAEEALAFEAFRLRAFDG